MIYSEHISTRIDDFDHCGKIKPAALLRLFENAAASYLSSTDGFMPMELAEQDRWVLAGWRVELPTVPGIGEASAARMETWMACELPARSAEMQFLLRSNGSIAPVRATAQFARLNRAGEPMEVDETLLTRCRPEKRRVFTDVLPRITLPETFTAEWSGPMRKADMDFYGHTHNTIYMDLAEEVLPEGIFDAAGSHALRIIYLHSLVRGDTATVRYALIGDNHTVGVFSGEQICAIVEIR